MGTTAEAKYKISAEDKGSEAFRSFKRNVSGANQMVAKFHATIRLGALALGAGGLGRAFMEAVREGSKFDAGLAAANANVEALDVSSKNLRYSLASGVAPALSLAARRLREFADAQREEQESRNVGGVGESFASTMIATLTGMSYLQPAIAAQLALERMRNEEAGQTIIQQKEINDLNARAAQLIDSVSTPQERYNAAMMEYNDLLAKGLLLRTDFDRLQQAAHDKAFGKAIKIEDVKATMSLDPVEEFPWDSAEWHQMLIDSMMPSKEDIPLAKTRWELFMGEIHAAATEAAGGMNKAFTDAIFDIENAFDHLKNYAENVLRAISDAMMARYITGPILAGLGLDNPTSSSGGSSWGYDGEFLGPPAPPVIGEKSLGGSGVTVQVNVTAIDTKSGMEFVVSQAKTIGAVVRAEVQRGAFAGA